MYLRIGGQHEALAALAALAAWARLGLIAVASLVLLVTAVPQVASAIGLKSLGSRLAAPLSCSSGSSGSGSGSSGQCAPGTLTGTVTVTGAPSGFSPAYLGAGACPASTSPGLACTSPQYTLALGGTYSLSLGPGKWDVAGFYENSGSGGVFLGTPQVLTIPSGGTVTRNFAVPYQSPATVKGTVSVTGVPIGVTVYQLSVLLCPSYAPYTGGFPSIACVNGYPQLQSPGTTSAPYVITGLPPGQWTAFPSYCTQFGCATNANAGKNIKLVAGRTRRADLTTPFLVPSEGLLSATVTVSGAPPGFSDPLAISACQAGGTSCETFFAYEGSSFPILLSDGRWTVRGLYQIPPFYNDVVGPSQTITIRGGQTTTVGLVVPYQALGGVTGAIRVTGKAPRVPITSYTVVACPSPAGRTSPQCINEYSGPGGLGLTNAVTRRANGAARSAAATARAPFNMYQLLTLTPGQWTLYPGYSTAFGSYSDPVGTTVTITANQTITQRLAVPYQLPSVGVVTGKVNAIGVPLGGFQSGVQACTAPPTGTSCPGEQFAFSNPTDGTYTLSLSPGTWWVAGFVDIYTSTGVSESTSTAQPITVTPGSETKASFTVRAS